VGGIGGADHKGSVKRGRQAFFSVLPLAKSTTFAESNSELYCLPEMRAGSRCVTALGQIGTVL